MITSTNGEAKEAVLRRSGALEDTIVENRLNTEDDQQNASNVLDILKGAVLQLKDTIEDELLKKKVIKYYW